MTASGLRGSFPLTSEGISNNVTRTSAGAYALGYTKNELFYVDYVGRADANVAGRLRDHVGKYKRFKYEYYDSPKAAFMKECRLYHDFNPHDNKVHPARPAGSGWKCPVCRVFD